jgi:hypothetical protein
MMHLERRLITVETDKGGKKFSRSPNGPAGEFRPAGRQGGG